MKQLSRLDAEVSAAESMVISEIPRRASKVMAEFILEADHLMNLVKEREFVP